MHPVRTSSGLLDSTDEHLVDRDAIFQRFARDHAALSESVCLAAEVRGPPKPSNRKWPRSVRKWRPTASITCGPSCRAPPAGRSSACRSTAQPLPGPPVQRGAGEHVVGRVGPRQIAHRQPAQHGGCRARPGSANRWSGFGRSSSSRPRPTASCLPQLVTNQRPVLDQLVFIKLHHHARTLLAHPRNQESRYSFAAGDSFLTDTPVSADREPLIGQDRCQNTGRA